MDYTNLQDPMNNQTPLNMYFSLCMRITAVALAIFFLNDLVKGKPSGILFLVGLAFLYGFYYLNSRSYLIQTFQNGRPIESIVKNNDQILDTVSVPFNNTPINSVDDYEYNMVFTNENDREITKELRNKLMSQYPMDWSVQPASSAYFTKGQRETFKDVDASGIDASGIDVSNNETLYANVSGKNMQPPNTDKAEIEEREILQTYVPKNTNDLKTYNIDDAQTLIKKIYGVKGLIPQVVHKEDTNVYEIVGVRSKNEKIQYEDDLKDARASSDAVRENNESVTVVPQAATDLLYNTDPFYDNQNKTRIDKWDYTKWTEGLERTVAPTYSTSQWY